MAPKNKRGSPMPLILMIAGGLLILGAVGWSIFAGSQAPQAAQTQAPGEISTESIPRVSPADAKAAVETGQAVIVDVRSADAYAESHVAGALSIPLDELPARITELNPSDWIITY